MIHPPVQRASKLGEMLPYLAETVDKEHKGLLARTSIIEKRKEEQEHQLLEMEREEDSKRLRLQKIAKEEEQKRLASEYEQRKNQRILREIEERELEQAEKHTKRKIKKPILEGKLAKTMDYLERAKREVVAPLIEAAFRQRLVEENVLHELEQRLEIELSRQRHDGDLKEKNRLARMLSQKTQFQERVENRLRAEREERLNQILHQRRQDREYKRKMLFYTRKTEEERQRRLREEEEARKGEERLALGPSELPGMSHPLEPGVAAPAAPPPSPSSGRYVPKFRRERIEISGQAPPPEPDRCGSSRQDDHMSQSSYRWQRQDRRPSFGGSKSS